MLEKEINRENTLLTIRKSVDIFGTPEYISHSIKSHSEEIPEFIHWCIDFKNNFTGTVEDDIKAWWIYETFIREDGESQVNISSDVRKNIEKGLVEGNFLEKTIFDEAFQEVKKLGVSNFFQRL